MKESKEVLSHKEIARRGGLARAESLGAERRHEIASLGGRISAQKRKGKKKTKKATSGK